MRAAGIPRAQEGSAAESTAVDDGHGGRKEDAASLHKSCIAAGDHAEGHGVSTDADAAAGNSHPVLTFEGPTEDAEDAWSLLTGHSSSSTRVL